jgi:hypothetical protein
MNAQQNAQTQSSLIDEKLMKINSKMGSNAEMKLNLMQLIGNEAELMDLDKGKPIYEHYANEYKKDREKLFELQREDSVLGEQRDSLLLLQDKIDTTKLIKDSNN